MSFEGHEHRNFDLEPFSSFILYVFLITVRQMGIKGI